MKWPKGKKFFEVWMDTPWIVIEDAIAMAPKMRVLGVCTSTECELERLNSIYSVLGNSVLITETVFPEI